MRSHKLIDILRGKTRHRVEGDPGAVANAIHFLSRAPVFDFGELGLEVTITPEGRHLVRAPSLTPDEYEWLREGLIPLPFHECIFEFRMATAEWFVMLTATTLTEEYINAADKPFDLSRPLPWDGGAAIPACRAILQSIKVSGESVHVTGIWVREEIGMPWVAGFNHGDPKATRPVNFVSESSALVERHMAVERRIGREKLVEWMRVECAGPFATAQYLLMMLMSRSTAITYVEPDAALIKAQAKRGDTPKRRYAAVVIDKGAKVRAAGGGTHASPSKHWRRSHVRVLHRGTAAERRIMIARVLVGVRDDFEPVHNDYRVKGASR